MFALCDTPKTTQLAKVRVGTTFSTMEIHKYNQINLHLISTKNIFYIAMLLFLIIPSAVQASIENTNFSFTRFGPNIPDIKFEGDAYALDPVIKLTKNYEDITNYNGSVGRATYAKPIHLWDKASGHVAGFTAHFSFVIKSLGNMTTGNGFAFFLAPNGSQIPPSSGEGYLGLYSDTVQSDFVAVEFDTKQSRWDAEGEAEHIGIDISSMSSVKTVDWSANDIGDGERIESWISYNSSSKNLSVDVACHIFERNYSHVVLYSLSFPLDLSDYLPEWVTLGFSAATTRECFETHEIFSWDFTSSLQVPENGRRRKSQVWLWAIVGSCNTVVFCLCLFVFCWWMKRRRQREGRPACLDDGFEEKTGPRSFAYEELVAATSNFADARLLGRGGFGMVYLGFLSDRYSTTVAVKRIISDSQHGFKEYASEVKTISQLRHRNLVQLVGWCRKEQELFVVYEFMPQKSLDNHLFSSTYLLAWETRYHVALGLASALLYLQEECEQCVLHRDIKLSNVLLDSNFNAKLGDFGLARLVEHGQGSHTTKLIGTEGYIAPEYLQSSKPSKQSDVYSFGVVALQIACGKPAVQEADRNGMKLKMKLVEWVWEQYGSGNILAAADPRLGQNYVEEEMKRLIVIGLACAHPNHYHRPSIREAFDMLNAKVPLPVLPLEMPVPALTITATHQANMSGSRSSSEATNASERGQAQFSVNNGSI